MLEMIDDVTQFGLAQGEPYISGGAVELLEINGEKE